MMPKISLRLGAVFSVIGGVLILLQSSGLSLSFNAFSVSMLVVSGFLSLIGGVFVYYDRDHRVLWGTIVLFSAAFSLLAIGISGASIYIGSGIIVFLIDALGGAIGISSKS